MTHFTNLPHCYFFKDTFYFRKNINKKYTKNKKGLRLKPEVLLWRQDNRDVFAFSLSWFEHSRHNHFTLLRFCFQVFLQRNFDFGASDKDHLDFRFWLYRYAIEYLPDDIIGKQSDFPFTHIVQSFHCYSFLLIYWFIDWLVV